jgi:hypothetical protein
MLGISNDGGEVRGTTGVLLRMGRPAYRAPVDSVSMTIPNKTDELDLELPALDGEDDPFEPDAPELIAMFDEGASDLDDTTGLGDAAHDDVTFDGAEGGWLLDSEDAAGLDVGAFDVAIGAEGRVLDDDDAEGRLVLDDLVAEPEGFVSDGGEEGPIDGDDELREEDLPALDADDDGDVPDEALFDRSLLTSDDDLRWDDRAWARADGAAIGASEPEDSGLLAVPSEDPANARDATWRRLDASGRVMAACYVPGSSVVLAIASADRCRALLVRIKPDGEARIIAEVEGDASCVVTFVRWDASGALVVGGTFGVETYRPA